MVSRLKHPPKRCTVVLKGLLLKNLQRYRYQSINQHSKPPNPTSKPPQTSEFPTSTSSCLEGSRTRSCGHFRNFAFQEGTPFGAIPAWLSLQKPPLLFFGGRLEPPGAAPDAAPSAPGAPEREVPRGGPGRGVLQLGHVRGRGRGPRGAGAAAAAGHGADARKRKPKAPTRPTPRSLLFLFFVCLCGSFCLWGSSHKVAVAQNSGAGVPRGPQPSDFPPPPAFSGGCALGPLFCEEQLQEGMYNYSWLSGFLGPFFEGEKSVWLLDWIFRP